MKEKTKIILLTIVIMFAVLCILVLIIPLLFGYKPIYMQEYTIDLEKTYFVWATLGSVATVVAIFIAILIPRGIAKKQNILIEKQALIAEQQTEILQQQNKIALFDKRYEVYQEFENLKYFRKLLEIEGSPFTGDKSMPAKWNMDRSSFISYKGISSSAVENLKPGELLTLFSGEAKKTVNKLNEVNLLFGTDKKADDLSVKYSAFIMNLIVPGSYEESRKEFLECFDTFGMDEFIDNLKKQLKL